MHKCVVDFNRQSLLCSNDSRDYDNYSRRGVKWLDDIFEITDYSYSRNDNDIKEGVKEFNRCRSYFFSAKSNIENQSIDSVISKYKNFIDMFPVMVSAYMSMCIEPINDEHTYDLFAKIAREKFKEDASIQTLLPTMINSFKAIEDKVVVSRKEFYFKAFYSGFVKDYVSYNIANVNEGEDNKNIYEVFSSFYSGFSDCLSKKLSLEDIFYVFISRDKDTRCKLNNFIFLEECSHALAIFIKQNSNIYIETLESLNEQQEFFAKVKRRIILEVLKVSKRTSEKKSFISERRKIITDNIGVEIEKTCNQFPFILRKTFFMHRDIFFEYFSSTNRSMPRVTIKQINEREGQYYIKTIIRDHDASMYDKEIIFHDNTGFELCIKTGEPYINNDLVKSYYFGLYRNPFINFLSKSKEVIIDRIKNRSFFSCKNYEKWPKYWDTKRDDGSIYRSTLIAPITIHVINTDKSAVSKNSKAFLCFDSTEIDFFDPINDLSIVNSACTVYSQIFAGYSSTILDWHKFSKMFINRNNFSALFNKIKKLPNSFY